MQCYHKKIYSIIHYLYANFETVDVCLVSFEELFFIVIFVLRGLKIVLDDLFLFTLLHTFLLVLLIFSLIFIYIFCKNKKL